jgi:hypothetical protein
MEAHVANYENDPNYPRRNRPGSVEEETNYTGWVIGGLVALALAIGLFTMFGRDTATTNTAVNNPRPVTTTTTPAPLPAPVPTGQPARPATTGSGSNQ